MLVRRRGRPHEPVPWRVYQADDEKHREATMTVTHTVASTPLGDLTLVADDGMLTGVYFPHHWHRPGPSGFGERDDRGFGPVREQLAEYFSGQRTVFDVPVRADGDEFQHRVWDVIAAIPYGETVSYGEIARRLGDGVLAKDVGSATGRNPLSVVVPCHRVVGKDGSLTGYAGGLKRKRYLLDLESAASPAAADRLF
jgi:methylated-DNA-[protein]-cysteine S-methyltransferase